MRSLLVIAGNSFHQALRTRTFLLVLLGSLGLALFSLEGIGFTRAASEAGELERAAAIRTSQAAATLQIWGDAALLVAIVLGATAVSSELRRGSLVTILARPLSRATFLVGKWLGLELFLVCFLALGAGSSLLLLGLPALEPTPVFWLGVIALVVRTILVSALAVGLGALLTPALAGGLAVLLIALPSLVGSFLEHPLALPRLLALGAYYLCPAELPGDLITEGLTQEALLASHGLYLRLLLENLVYAGLALAACSLAFSRRELSFPS